MQLEELKSKFEQFLRQRGHKITRGRFEIIDKIANYGPHFEIEELVRWIANQDRSAASRSTVYRTVRLLQEFGAIREVIKLGNRTIYEFVAGKPHHEHLICVECGKIIEFYKQEIEELQDRVCEEHRFSPINHRLEIFGVCSDCKEKKHESRGMEVRT
ncbi:MAG: Fur family transcriptional regulator [Aquificaceae bacterium]|nr:transcriptional repressor [Aquificaceae bacterium]MCS7277517.1 transcriptional repressor [Aquificaceae bacterium]MDW8066132.1 Fur family transcriptional regulator [Aquificaceae bacterium]MDW8423416.1 Fur family transcriptional regulator [Aquificaceae bacterium]